MLQLFQPRPDLKAAHIFADHLEATLDLAEELGSASGSSRA